MYTRRPVEGSVIKWAELGNSWLGLVGSRAHVGHQLRLIAEGSTRPSIGWMDDYGAAVDIGCLIGNTNDELRIKETLCHVVLCCAVLRDVSALCWPVKKGTYR